MSFYQAARRFRQSEREEVQRFGHSDKSPGKRAKRAEQMLKARLGICTQKRKERQELFPPEDPDAAEKLNLGGGVGDDQHQKIFCTDAQAWSCRETPHFYLLLQRVVGDLGLQ